MQWKDKEEEKEEEEGGTRLSRALKINLMSILDSLVTALSGVNSQEFCGRSTQSRRRYCLPGANFNDVYEAANTVCDGAKADTLYVIHAGTNDVKSTRTEALLDKYRGVIRRYKEKSRHIIVSGILPRINGYAGFHSKARALMLS